MCAYAPATPTPYPCPPNNDKIYFKIKNLNNHSLVIKSERRDMKLPFTALEVSITSLCDNFSLEIPDAILVMHEIPPTFIPICVATMASGAVDIPN